MKTENLNEPKNQVLSKDDVIVLSAIEKMTDAELAEEQRVLNAEIEAATQRLGSVENELFYRKHPECRRH